MRLGEEIQLVSEGRLGAGGGGRVDDVVPLVLVLNTQLGNIQFLLSESSIVPITKIVQIQQ